MGTGPLFLLLFLVLFSGYLFICVKIHMNMCAQVQKSTSGVIPYQPSSLIFETGSLPHALA